MGSPLCDHLARLCLQCDWKLHYETVENHDKSRIPLCNNCVSETAVVQCLDKGLSLCQTCVLNPNIFSRFFLLQNGSNYNSAYNCLDFDSSSSSCSSSFVDRNWPLSHGSLPLFNEDSSSSFEIFQRNENYTRNSYSDQQVPMLRPGCLDIPKDSSYSGFNGYETKEDIENVFLNGFDGDEAVLNEYNPNEDLILTDHLIDELTKHNPETTSTKVLTNITSIL
ncbi:PREDICTED: zinc finger protein CONSTANS-LIKE 12-like [Camelina sativa]|uniref:Zinc finger protein CONSTANS-LIKE 12-like n=1 Tax=Camelina sativa TaxID=90675 RepID=A0ABM1QW20_CAMSA|nr:PREDICTED: zinc finger protein CONSTANS-LIKE 12-like [Camelina sativa]